MLPLARKLSFFRNRLHPVGQDPPVLVPLGLREKEGGVIPSPFDRLADRLLRIVPETDRQMQLEPLFENASGKIPTHQKALPDRRILLPRVGRPDVAARQVLPVDPFLLHIEMVLIARSEVDCGKE